MKFVEYSEMELEHLRQRLALLTTIVLCLFGILVLKLSYLQIVKGNYYRKISEHNRIRLIPIPAPRGMIFDRNGQLLARDIPSFDISLIQLGLSKKTIDQTLINLNKIISFDIEAAKKSIMCKGTRPFEPATIIPDVSQEVLAMVAEKSLDLPGVIIHVSLKRSYTYGNLCSHLLGYLGEVSEADLRDKKEYGYKYGDLIGKSGIEKTYNHFLRGRDGGKQIEVDVKGRQLRVLGEMEPVPGNNLTLSIDSHLQEIADSAMGEKNGAVVVLNAKNGEILAMVSKPTFDPNMFLGRMSSSQARKLFTDERYPLLNRAIQAQYAPGSVFKIIVTACALENDMLDLNDTFICDGIYWLGKQRFICFQKEQHGQIGIIDALARSCNIFFYQLGIRLGVDKLSDFAMRLGLGKKTDIDLPNEKSGLVPTRSWKKRVRKEDWYSGNTVNLSIGQGHILVTPLQIANAISAIVNGGNVFVPHIVKKMVDSSGNTKILNPKIANLVPLSPQHREIINQGLEAVVNRGTGLDAYIPWMRVGGKTGTAQNPKGEDHAWFVCYTPVDNPKVVVAVIVEHGGKGGLAAAPVARTILQGIDWKGLDEKGRGNGKVGTETTWQPLSTKIYGNREVGTETTHQDSSAEMEVEKDANF